LTVVTTLFGLATHRFVEPEFTQLIALFEEWREEIDSVPFAYEGEWARVDSPAFDVVSAWPGEPHVDCEPGLP
jgi:hypothetical protein